MLFLLSIRVVKMWQLIMTVLLLLCIIVISKEVYKNDTGTNY